MMNTVHTRCEFCNCHLCGVRTGEIKPTPILFSSETYFTSQTVCASCRKSLLRAQSASTQCYGLCVLCCECNYDYWAHFLSCDHKFTSICYTHFTIL